MSFFSQLFEPVGGVVGGIGGGIYEGAGLGSDFDPQVTMDEQSNRAFATQQQAAEDRAMLEQQMAAAAGTHPGEFRGRQMGLADALQARVAGEAPSVAEMQLQGGLDRAIASQQAQAASMRGVNPALAARLAAQQSGSMMTQVNQQAAMLRAQEQAQAEGRLGQLLGQARGADIGARQFYTQQALSQERIGQLDAQERERMRQQQLQQQQAMRYGMAQQEQQLRAQAAGDVLSGTAQGVAATQGG